MSEQRDRMRAGELYKADDAVLTADHLHAQDLLERYNTTSARAEHERQGILRQLLGSCGEQVVIKPPLRCDYGQYIHVGQGTFINYDAVLLDVTTIRIGAFCQLGPRVQILAATHPVDPRGRRSGWESGEPVTIGDN